MSDKDSTNGNNSKNRDTDWSNYKDKVQNRDIRFETPPPPKKDNSPNDNE